MLETDRAELDEGDEEFGDETDGALVDGRVDERQELCRFRHQVYRLDVVRLLPQIILEMLLHITLFKSDRPIRNGS